MYRRSYTGDKVQIQSFIEQIDKIVYIFIDIFLLHISAFFKGQNLSGVMAKSSVIDHRFIPSRLKLKTIKWVFAASPHNTQH
jgi:hypothetical protein